MPNRVTTWQPQHQQHASDIIIFPTSEECFHTLIVTHTEFLTYANTKITPEGNVIKSQTIRSKQTQFNQLAAFMMLRP